MGGATGSNNLRKLRGAISIHAPRGGRDVAARAPTAPGLVISIHAPRGGRDPMPSTASPPTRYFNPRAPWGARQHVDAVCGKSYGFQSTRPVGGATPIFQLRDVVGGISIHAPRGGRDGRNYQGAECPRISIHAPRGGRDLVSVTHVVLHQISIHAPRGGRDDTVQDSGSR